MADHDSLAARMYPAADGAAGAPQPAQASTATTTAPEANAAPAPVQAVTADTAPPADAAASSGSVPGGAAAAPTLNAEVDELVGREPSLAERMSGGTGLESVEQAASVLDVRFQLPTDCPEDAQAVREGHRVAAELLVELSVPKQEANVIASVLGDWHGKVMGGYVADDGVMNSTAERAKAELRAEWGKDYDARVALARRVASDAMKRAPWLRELIVDTPAGNSTALIRQLSELGIKQARSARRKAG